MILIIDIVGIVICASIYIWLLDKPEDYFEQKFKIKERR
jgi:hypothetical protein